MTSISAQPTPIKSMADAPIPSKTLKNVSTSPAKFATKYQSGQPKTFSKTKISPREQPSRKVSSKRATIDRKHTKTSKSHAHAAKQTSPDRTANEGGKQKLLDQLAKEEHRDDSEGNTVAINLKLGLAITYKDEKKYNKAIPHFKEALAGFEKAADFGDTHRSTVICIQHIGDSYYAMKDYDQALSYYTLVMHRSASDSTNSASTPFQEIIKNMATIYDYREENDRALEYYQKVTKEYEKNPESDPAAKSEIEFCIARIHMRKREYDVGLAQFQQILLERETRLGNNDPATIETVRWMGFASANCNNIPQAATYYDRVFLWETTASHERHLNDLTTAPIFDTIGRHFKTEKTFDKAAVYIRRAISIYDKFLGKQSQEYLMAVRHLGEILSEDGKTKDAKRCYETALHGYQVIGDDRSSFEMANLLAFVKAQLGDASAALEDYDLALRGFLKTEEPSSKLLSGIVAEMSSLYTKQRRFTYKRQKFESALKGFKGNYSDAVLDAFWTLAKHLHPLGLFEDSLHWLSRVVESKAKIHGVGHASTRDCLEEMAKILPLVPQSELPGLKRVFSNSLQVFNVGLDIAIMDILKNMAHRFRKRKLSSESLYWLEFVLSKYESYDKDANESAILGLTREIAEVEEESQNWVMALFKYKVAATGYSHSGEPEPAMKCVKAMMVILPQLGRQADYEAGSKHLLSALEIYDDDRYPDAILLGLLELAQSLDKQERKSKSYEWYDRLLSRYSSESLSETTMGIYERALHLMSKRAGAFAKKEDYDKSLKWYRRSVSASIEIWGRDHLTTLNSIRSVIFIIQEAKPYNPTPLEEALKPYDEQYPETILRYLFHMATNFVVRNRLQHAHIWYQQILSGCGLSNDLIGSEIHQKALDSISDVAASLKENRRYDESLQWYKMALDSCGNHPDLSLIKCELLLGRATVATEIKNVDDAIGILNNVLDISSTPDFIKNGDNSKKVRNAALERLYSIGITLRDSKDENVDKKYQILESCLLRHEAFEPTGPPTCTQYVTILDDIRHMASKRDRHYDPNRALAWYNRALAGYERISTDHEGVFRILHDIANIQRDIGDFETAIKTLSRVAARSETQYGPHNHRMVSVMSDIADLYHTKGEEVLSLEWRIKAYTGYAKNRPSTNPEVLRRAVTIAVLYRTVDKNQALEWYSKALVGYKKSSRFGEMSEEYRTVATAIAELQPPPPPPPPPPRSATPPPPQPELNPSPPADPSAGDDTAPTPNSTQSIISSAAEPSVTDTTHKPTPVVGKLEKPTIEASPKHGSGDTDANSLKHSEESREKRKRRKHRSESRAASDDSNHEPHFASKHRRRKSRPASISEASQETGVASTERRHPEKKHRSRSRDELISLRPRSSRLTSLNLLKSSAHTTSDSPDELLLQAAEKAKAKELDDALNLYQRALSIYEKTLGKKHHKSLAIVEKMASVFKKKKQYIHALEFYFRVYITTAKDSDSKRQITAVKTLRRMISILTKETKSYTTSAKLLRQALKIRRGITNDKRNLTALHKIAVKLSKRKWYVEALEWFRIALDGRIGTQDDAMHCTMHMMAKALAGAGKHVDAVKMCRLALEGYKKMDGPDADTTKKVAQDLKRLQSDKSQRRR
ncbi:TPR-like protein [Ascodesmis nigricans]|uniref:TPR-like protein n=1 Tax=Ascodesmis nigricans TaxID=341454 RepID=A0A4S2MYM6_9PEZI|nr:TPR-like protein [Ascodesmis nigricans]